MTHIVFPQMNANKRKWKTFLVIKTIIFYIVILRDSEGSLFFSVLIGARFQALRSG
jgi:hypothetical protein